MGKINFFVASQNNNLPISIINITGGDTVYNAVITLKADLLIDSNLDDYFFEVNTQFGSLIEKQPIPDNRLVFDTGQEGISVISISINAELPIVVKKQFYDFTFTLTDINGNRSTAMTSLYFN